MVKDRLGLLGEKSPETSEEKPRGRRPQRMVITMADGKQRLIGLAHALQEANEKTRKAREAKQKKKMARLKRDREETGAAEVEDPKGGLWEKVNPKTVSTDVYEWYRIEMKRKFGQGFIVPSWTVRQHKIAKDLLKEYGPDLVEKGIRYFVRQWERIAQRGDFSGVPSINLLWGMREQIFGDVQLGRTRYGTKQDKLLRGERKPDDGTDNGEGPDQIGW